MALENTEVGGYLSKLCARRTGAKRDLAVALAPQEVERLKVYIIYLERCISQMQRKENRHDKNRESI
jgi:hypothetical protein